MERKGKIVLIVFAIIATAIVSGAFTFSIGYARGFNACIEENNLYNEYRRTIK